MNRDAILRDTLQIPVLRTLYRVTQFRVTHYRVTGYRVTLF
jgi:hypothetical protein